MADKDWDDVPYVDGDCVRDEDEWNDMVDYIRHSACTVFTIYSTCPSTGQAFKFTQDGTESIMYGGLDSGDDLLFYANSTDTLFAALRGTGEFELSIDGTIFLSLYEDGTDDIIEGNTAGNDLKLIGAEGIHNYFKAGEEFKLFNGTDEILKVTWSAGVRTIMEGGDATGDDFTLKCNSSDQYPYFGMLGNSHAYIAVAAARNFYINYGITKGLNVAYAANVTTVQGGDVTGDDLIFKGNNVDGDKITIEGAGDIFLEPTGLVKWGVEQTNAGSDRGELIEMKTAAGDTVYLKTYDLV